MTRCKATLILMMFLIVAGCATGTSGTKPGGSLEPKGRINCATIDLESMTSEERQFCHGGRL